MKGRIILLPTYLSASNDASHISDRAKGFIREINHYLVEDVRTARRFISSLRLGIEIPELQFEVLNKSTDLNSIESLLKVIEEGKDVGVMSEAGLPGIADPGGLVVGWAHQKGVEVVPLEGGNSIILALIASGFNGQRFSFHGYLPINKREREERLKELDQTLSRTGYTQLFMEAPYRNNQMLESILNSCNPRTYLAIVADVTGEAFVGMKTCREWKNETLDLHKRPAIFALGFPVFKT